MSDVYSKALELHKANQGKIRMESKVSVTSKEELSLAYSPGVAKPCLEIQENPEASYDYTARGNIVAVISDGTAVLGLGDIGPLAAMPVMEGKSILLKEFAGVDSWPLVLNTKDTEEIIQTIKNIAPSFGGINLEDIAAPKCVEIERRLKAELDIPVFHDDQHGTAIVTTAAMINACKLSGKKVEDLTVVLSGTGAAGSSIARLLKDLGVKAVYGYNRKGIVTMDKYDNYRFVVKELLDDGILDSPDTIGDDSLAHIMKGADVFVGVSVAGLVTKEMVESMNDDPFIFAMANPTPEIMPEDALEAGAFVVGTGRSDYPNQINNVLAFPGIFKGALAARSQITESMKMAAAKAIAECVSEEELSREMIVPSPFMLEVADAVAEAVKKEADNK
jgi:malate dehydrogenase (oxaloacetate-decarboxylating)